MEIHLQEHFPICTYIHSFHLFLYQTESAIYIVFVIFWKRLSGKLLSFISPTMALYLLMSTLFQSITSEDDSLSVGILFPSANAQSVEKGW